MSILKALLALLAAAIVLTVVFHVDILKDKPILMIFSGILVILLLVAFFELLAELIGIAIGVIAFLFLLYLLLLVLRFLV